MGTWTTALTELRAQLNDQPNDRYCYRKKVFGDLNGVNTSFKTFEFRRVTDFSSDETVPPLGIYLGGVLQPYTAVESDDVASGEFTLSSAPTDNGMKLEATYYYQWFEDAELSTFLLGASRWLQQGEDYTVIAGGLTQAALDYASMLAYRKMATRWATRASATFLLEDAPKKEATDAANTYSNIAMAYEKSATNFRNDFYTKSGQNLAVNFADNFGVVSGVTPRR